MTYLGWCGEANAMIWDFLKWVVQLKLIAMFLLLCQTKSMTHITQWESMSSWKDPSWWRTWDFAGPSANHDVYTSHTASKILHPQFYNMDTYKIPTSFFQADPGIFWIPLHLSFPGCSWASINDVGRHSYGDARDDGYAHSVHVPMGHCTMSAGRTSPGCQHVKHKTRFLN